MSSLSNDNCSKKFQLTDSLLQRILNQEDYSSIKTIEPAVIVTDESSNKRVKNLGYKHAVVTNRFLHVINTPAKQKSDILLSLPLQDVKNVKLVRINISVKLSN